VTSFLTRVAAELRGKDLGDGLVHRVAYDVARAKKKPEVSPAGALRGGAR